MSKGGKYLNNPQQTQKSPEKKTGKKKIFLIILAVILAVVVITGVSAVLYFRSIISHRTQVQTVRPTLPEQTTATAAATESSEIVETTEETEPDYGKSGKVINVLVVGQAAREGEEARIADTIMLATINKETSTITVTSFLRDTYIQFPNPYTDVNGRRHTCGHNKINMAYALGYSWGGAADAMMFLDQTLTNNFGIEIDYNVEVDFEAFGKVVSMLGGVDVDLTAEEAAYLNKYFDSLEAKDDWRKQYKEGTNWLDGWAALTYARMRKAAGDNDSDIKRANRQRHIINIILQKASTKSIAELTDIAKSVMPYITTDMTDSEIATLILEVLPIVPSLKFESNQIPAEGTMWSKQFEENGFEVYALDFDIAKNKSIMQSIAEADHQ